VLDYNTLQVLLVIAFLLLVADVSVSLFINMKLLHKCRVVCDDSDSD